MSKHPQTPGTGYPRVLTYVIECLRYYDTFVSDTVEVLQRGEVGLPTKSACVSRPSNRER